MKTRAIVGIIVTHLLFRFGAQAQPQNAAIGNVDVLHYVFTIVLPDTGRSIRGTALVSLRRIGAVDGVRLDLVGLNVDSVQVDGARSSFVRDSLTINVPLAYQNNDTCDTLTLRIDYGGLVSDGLMIGRDNKGRWTAFGDNWPERARFWLPCRDRPDDKAMVEWRVIAPADRQVVANGAFVERTLVHEGYRDQYALTVWKESQPISTYLMVIAAAPMAKFDLCPSQVQGESSNCDVQQSVYVEPELSGYLPGPFKYANNIVSYFSGLIGQFPYEKLDHVQSSTQYGGMENASAIFYASEGISSRTMEPEIIAHETAHQWFGDAVTEKKWAQLWLSEGFATYFEELWTKHEFGDSAFRAELERTRAEVFQSTVVSERPVIDSLQTNLTALLDVNSYQKGAWVLRMLHSMLGDSTFFTSLRSYYKHYRNSTVVTDDLEREFEATAQQNLRWFFDEWLRRPGFATLSTDWSYDDLSRRVELTVRQMGPFPPYRFFLTVESIAADGKRFYERVLVQATETNEFKLKHVFAKKPLDIKFDPDVELLARMIVQ